MQRYTANEKQMQQQEEDEWLQSVQAEEDADPRNQYWVMHVCHTLQHTTCFDRPKHIFLF